MSDIVIERLGKKIVYGQFLYANTKCGVLSF